MTELQKKLIKLKVPEIKKIIREYNTIKIKLTQKKGDLVNALDKHLVLDGDKMKWKNSSPFKDKRDHKPITDIVAVEGTDRTLKEKLPSRKSLKKSVKPNEKLTIPTSMNLGHLHLLSKCMINLKQATTLPNRYLPYLHTIEPITLQNKLQNQ